MDSGQGKLPVGAGSGRGNETQCKNDVDLGKLLMDGKVIGTLDEDGVMRYKLTPLGRIAAEREMASYVQGMCPNQADGKCNGRNRCSSPLKSIGCTENRNGSQEKAEVKDWNHPSKSPRRSPRSRKDRRLFRPGPGGAAASTWVDNPTTAAEEEYVNCNIPSKISTVGVTQSGDYETLLENQEEWVDTTSVGPNGGMSGGCTRTDMESVGSDSDDDEADGEMVEFNDVVYDPDDVTVAYVDDGDDKEMKETSAKSIE
jgi:hypothetical protein